MECGALCLAVWALVLIYSPGTRAETELKCPQWWMKAIAAKVPEELIQSIGFSLPGLVC